MAKVKVKRHHTLILLIKSMNMGTSDSWKNLEELLKQFKQELLKISGSDECLAIMADSKHPLLKAHHTLRQTLERLPGAFLLTEAGSLAWERLLVFSRDENEYSTTAHLARQMKELLSQSPFVSNAITFIDDALLVRLYDGQQYPFKQNPLGYVAFRVLYAQKPNPVRWDYILEAIEKPDDTLLCPRLSDEVLQDIKKSKSRKTLQRAVAAIPEDLKKHIHPAKKGRFFDWRP